MRRVVEVGKSELRAVIRTSAGRKEEFSADHTVYIEVNFTAPLPS